ncbi:MAG: ImmA/IrrE family metallo-endopeptidase [Verrucomicrobiales bacterium]|nr:ImmA/IrrE family metallo-endopeptidase [Verrucomicrobiales bacterium]
MKPNRAKAIRLKASELLQQCGVVAAPVDVEKIAAELGIAVRRTPTDDDISGFLLHQTDSEVVIGVNTLHHPNRQRFTIAHELGHYVLHQYDEVHVDRAVVRLRSGESSSGENPDEVEANRFAAELLMPENFIRLELSKMTFVDFSDERRMQQFAKQFGVSVQAMSRRIVDLGISA